MSGTSASASGLTRTLTVPVTFAAGYHGLQSVYGWAQSAGGVSGPAALLGTWLARARIDQLTPLAAGVGEAVTVTGAGFGASPGAVFVHTTPLVVTAWSDTSVTAAVPAGAATGPVTVVTHGTPSNAPYTLTVLGAAPTLSSLSPPFGPVATVVTLTGFGFGAAPGSGDAVTFAGAPAAVSAWSDTAITVTVPPGAATGPVVVTRGGQASNGVGFTVAEDAVVYYHTDGIGSLRLVTDAAGQVVGRHDYLPFGEEWPGPASAERVRFAGKEFDAETGLGSWMPLHYFGARYLHTATGRFTAVDPVRVTADRLLDPQQLNLFGYARNNPLGFVDPDGRQACPTDYCVDVEGKLTEAQMAAEGQAGLLSLMAGRIYFEQSAAAQPRTEVPSSSPEPSWLSDDTRRLFRTAGSCFADHYGLTAAAAGAGALGLPVRKSWLGVSRGLAGASESTSVAGAIGYGLFGANEPRIGARILGTTRVFGIVGRAAPGVSAALFAWDAISIGYCTHKGMN